MALTVKNIHDQLGSKYKLNLIAGKNGLAHSISWIYYTEDASTIEYIRGGELAITLGINYQRQMDNKGDDSENLSEYLNAFIEKFIEHNAAGLIINTGKYIDSVPWKIIDICDRLSFPLFTMPWEVHSVDLMQDIGNLVITDRQNTVNAENLFYNAIFAPEKCDPNQITNTQFHSAKKFTVALLELPENFMGENLEQAKRYINFLFNPKINLPQSAFCSFIHERKIVYILSDDFMQSVKEISRTRQTDKYLKNSKISVSDTCTSLQDIADCYKHAKVSLEIGQPENGTAYYNDLGVYKILVEVKDKKVLEQFYEETLGALKQFGEDKAQDNLKTLQLYLKYGGNIQHISEENFSHRNTVIYRIKKLEEVLNLNLADGDTRCRIQVALYIKKLLLQ